MVRVGQIKIRNEFPDLLRQLNLTGGQGIEIGSWRGEFAEHILRNWPGTLHLVDPWTAQDHETYFDIMNQPQETLDGWFRECCLRMEQFPGRHHIYRLFSKDAASKFEPESMQFVYIDGNHSYEATVSDIELYAPLVITGGIVAGHDFLDSDNCCGSRFGVKSAVTEYFKDQDIFITDEAWPTWYVVKE